MRILAIKNKASTEKVVFRVRPFIELCMHRIYIMYKKKKTERQFKRPRAFKQNGTLASVGHTLFF